MRAYNEWLMNREVTIFRALDTATEVSDYPASDSQMDYLAALLARGERQVGAIVEEIESQVVCDTYIVQEWIDEVTVS